MKTGSLIGTSSHAAGRLAAVLVAAAASFSAFAADRVVLAEHFWSNG